MKRLVGLSLVIGGLVAALDSLAGTNAIDSLLVGGLSAVAAYIIGASRGRTRPVDPDRNFFWISGVDPPDGDGDGDD